MPVPLKSNNLSELTKKFENPSFSTLPKMSDHHQLSHLNGTSIIDTNISNINSRSTNKTQVDLKKKNFQIHSSSVISEKRTLNKASSSSIFNNKLESKANNNCESTSKIAKSYNDLSSTTTTTTTTTTSSSGSDKCDVIKMNLRERINKLQMNTNNTLNVIIKNQQKAVNNKSISTLKSYSSVQSMCSSGQTSNLLSNSTSTSTLLKLNEEPTNNKSNDSKKSFNSFSNLSNKQLEVETSNAKKSSITNNNNNKIKLRKQQQVSTPTPTTTTTTQTVKSFSKIIEKKQNMERQSRDNSIIKTCSLKNTNNELLTKKQSSKNSTDQVKKDQNSISKMSQSPKILNNTKKPKVIILRKSKSKRVSGMISNDSSFSNSSLSSELCSARSSSESSTTTATLSHSSSPSSSSSSSTSSSLSYNSIIDEQQEKISNSPSMNDINIDTVLLKDTPVYTSFMNSVERKIEIINRKLTKIPKDNDDCFQTERIKNNTSYSKIITKLKDDNNQNLLPLSPSSSSLSSPNTLSLPSSRNSLINISTSTINSPDKMDSLVTKHHPIDKDQHPNIRYYNESSKFNTKSLSSLSSTNSDINNKTSFTNKLNIKNFDKTKLTSISSSNIETKKSRNSCERDYNQQIMESSSSSSNNRVRTFYI
jgi:trimeric autotransporter adhesin